MNGDDRHPKKTKADRQRGEGSGYGSTASHGTANVSLGTPIAARPRRPLCLAAPRSFCAHERTKRFVHRAGVPEPSMDIRLEHNDVAAFHVALFLLPAYAPREVVRVGLPHRPSRRRAGSSSASLIATSDSTASRPSTM